MSPSVPISPRLVWVISGGRTLGSGENFRQSLEPVADKRNTHRSYRVVVETQALRSTICAAKPGTWWLATCISPAHPMRRKAKRIPGSEELKMAEYSDYTILNANESATLEKVVDILFPSEPDGVGAVNAGVMRYIDGLLAGRGAYLLDTYKSGLRWLHEEAGREGVTYFNDLDRSRQAEIVDAAMTRAVAASLPLDPPADGMKDIDALFMAAVWQHTREGLFGDPRHGGNREGMIWTWLGYSGPQLNGYTESEILENQTPSRPLRFAEDWRNRRG